MAPTPKPLKFQPKPPGQVVRKSLEERDRLAKIQNDKRLQDSLMAAAQPRTPHMIPTDQVNNRGQVMYRVTKPTSRSQSSRSQFPKNSATLNLLKNLRKIFYQSLPSEIRAKVKDFLYGDIEQMDPVVLKHRWNEFVEEEHKVSGMPISLVKPAGALDDGLTVLMHWPTNLSKFSGEAIASTRDHTNPCTRALVDKFGRMEHLVTEAYFRRAEVIKTNRSKTPMDFWTAAHRKVHENFADFIWERSKSKVWLIVGSKNQARYQKRYLKTLPLQVQEIEIKIRSLTYYVYMHYEGSSIWRIVLFGLHPETILHNVSLPMAQRMDTQYNLVVAILGEFVEKVRLFEDRWNEPEARHVGAWDLVLQNLKEEKLTGRCIPFAKLQPSLLLYIQKSFGEDVEGMLSKPDNNGNYRSPSRVCVALMRELGVEKGVLTRRSRSIFSQLYRDPMDEELTSVAVQCGVCNAQRTDKHPTYECTMGRYVARRLVCSDCRNTWHKPVDASIDFITYENLIKHVVGITEQDAQDSENVEAIENDQDSLAGDYDWNDRDVQADGSLKDIASLDWL